MTWKVKGVTGIPDFGTVFGLSQRIVQDRRQMKRYMRCTRNTGYSLKTRTVLNIKILCEITRADPNSRASPIDKIRSNIAPGFFNLRPLSRAGNTLIPPPLRLVSRVKVSIQHSLACTFFSRDFI